MPTRTEVKELDCQTEVLTPENVSFEYALAGPFQRLPAFLFDFVVRIVAYLAIVISAGIILGFAPFGGVLVNVLSILLFFVMSWFYGVFFETRFNGRTLGKMVFRLRVISVDGSPIDGRQAALRNLIRNADIYGASLSLMVFSDEAPDMHALPLVSIGLFVMLLTSRFQRLGDLVAGTMVISEHVSAQPASIAPEDMRAFGLAELIPSSFIVSNSLAKTVALYMENRRRLSPARRAEVAKHMAVPLIRRFELLPDTSYDLLLCALYVKTFMSAVQQEAGARRMRGDRRPSVLNANPLPPVMKPANAPAVEAGVASVMADSDQRQSSVPIDQPMRREEEGNGL